MSASNEKTTAGAAASSETSFLVSQSIYQDTTKHAVLQLLKTVEGDPNGISRLDLWNMTAFSDRQIRRAIAQLRAEFHPIGIGPNGGYTYGTIDGIKRAIADYHAKAARNYKMQFALEQAYAGLLNEHFPVLDDLAALEEVTT